MTVRRVLGIGLDQYTIDFDTDFFRGKPLDADVIAGGIKADEVRIQAMGHEFEWLLIDARGGAAAASAAARAALARRPVDVVVIGGGVRFDPAQTPVLGGAGERGDRGGAWGADRVQHFADRHGGGDYPSLVITRVLLALSRRIVRLRPISRGVLASLQLGYRIARSPLHRLPWAPRPCGTGMRREGMPPMPRQVSKQSWSRRSSGSRGSSARNRGQHGGQSRESSLLSLDRPKQAQKPRGDSEPEADSS